MARDLTVGLYSDGDFFGYTALLEGTTYKETAEAIDESLVAEIPISDFEHLLFSNKEATRQFIRLLARNISEKKSGCSTSLTIHFAKGWLRHL